MSVDRTTGTIDAESRIADWVAGLSAVQVPQAARDVARACIADGIGVMLAGSRTPVFAQCATLPRPAGECAIAGGGSTDARTAAFLNGVACHALDFDDTCYAGIVHGTAVVLPAVLAVVQDLDADGGRLLEAFVAGVETEYALGLAVTDSLYERGFWATTTLGVIGAAAGAARALGLGAERTAHAIRLAASMPLGLRAIHGSSGKPYLCGVAARLGVEVAIAARAGICGQPGMFERRGGFASTLNEGVLERAPLDALGARYALTDPGIAFKLRPLCSATQAALDAVAALRVQHGFGADDVQAVRCRGTPLVVASLPYRAPTLPSEAQFSMPFAVACTLLHGDVLPEHLTEELLAGPALRQLMERVELREDAVLVPAQATRTCPEAASVEIALRDGRRLERTVLAAAGMPQQPATPQQLFDKFAACAAPVAGADQVRALWEQARSVDDLSSVRHLLGGATVAGRA